MTLCHLATFYCMRYMILQKDGQVTESKNCGAFQMASPEEHAGILAGWLPNTH